MANALGIAAGTGMDYLNADGTGSLVIYLNVIYSGLDMGALGGPVSVTLPILVEPTDQPAAIRTKMSNAIVSEGTRLGVVVAPTNITIPTYQKG